MSWYITTYKLLSSAGEGVGGTGLADATQLDLKSLTAQFSQFADSATNLANSNAAPAPAPSAADNNQQEGVNDQVPDFQNLLSDAMQQMAQNNQAFQVGMVWRFFVVP